MARPEHTNTDTRENLLFRVAQLDTPEAVDAGAATLRVAFSSEAAVLRKDSAGKPYREILDHAPGNADVSLLANSGALLDEHDFKRQIGVIESVDICADKKGRATIRFCPDELSQTRAAQLASHTRPHISFGYVQSRLISTTPGADGIPVRRFAWQAYEISSVAVPADGTVGVGRSVTFPKQQTQYRTMQITEDKMASELDDRATVYAKLFPHIAGDIMAARLQAEADEKTPRDFARSIQELIARNPAPRTFAPVSNIGMESNDVHQFSLARAIRSFVETGRVGGFEAECSAQVERSSKMRPEGFFVPCEVVLGGSRRNYQRDMMATDFSSGGALVPSKVFVPIIELLRNRTVVQRLGATVLAGLSGNVLIPRQTSPATAHSVSEVATLAASGQTFDQIPATPHRVGATQVYSKQLVIQSAPDVEALIRDDVARVVGIAHDRLLLNGQGANSEPLGVFNTPGIGTITFGGAASWGKIVDFEATLSIGNADRGAMAFATTPKVKAAWKKIAVALTGATTVSANKLWEQGNFADDSNDGLVDGHRAASTNQIPNDLVLFGNWADLVLLQWGGLDIVIDPYTKAANAEIVITVNTWIDCAVRHPQSFVLSQDAGNQ